MWVYLSPMPLELTWLIFQSGDFILSTLIPSVPNPVFSVLAGVCWRNEWMTPDIWNKLVKFKLPAGDRVMTGKVHFFGGGRKCEILASRFLHFTWLFGKFLGCTLRRRNRIHMYAYTQAYKKLLYETFHVQGMTKQDQCFSSGLQPGLWSSALFYLHLPRPGRQLPDHVPLTPPHSHRADRPALLFADSNAHLTQKAPVTHP